MPRYRATYKPHPARYRSHLFIASNLCVSLAAFLILIFVPIN